MENITIGKYDAILRKKYHDGSVDYETDFDSMEDLAESYYAFKKLLFKIIGLEEKCLADISIIAGISEIEKEFRSGDGKKISYDELYKRETERQEKENKNTKYGKENLDALLMINKINNEMKASNLSFAETLEKLGLTMDDYANAKKFL